MGFSAQIPVHQVGGLETLWPLTGYAVMGYMGYPGMA